MEVWFNPACGSCRTAVAALDDAGVTFKVRRYLEDPPSTAELKDVLNRLGLEPWELARPSESADPANGVTELARDADHRGAWIEAMVTHPILIQRPVITTDDGAAVIARTPEALGEIVSRAVGR